MTLAGEAVIIWTATGLSVIAMSVAEKWEECSTLASTYNLVYDAYGLVLISSTLYSRYVSMKEYDVEERDNRPHKQKCSSCYLPKMQLYPYRIYKECSSMLELLLIPVASFGYALVSDNLRRKNDDKRKIQVFFEVSGIAIKKKKSYIIQNFKRKILMIAVQHTFTLYLLVCRVKSFRRSRMLFLKD